MPSPGFEPGSGERQRAVSGSALDLTAIRAGPYMCGTDMLYTLLTISLNYRTSYLYKLFIYETAASI